MPKAHSEMVTCDVVDRRRIRRCCWALSVASLLSVASACVRPQDSTLALSDRIESESDSLRLSQKTSTTFAQRFAAKTPWVVMFVSRKGFNEAAAAKAGIPEDLRRTVARRAPEWDGSALIVYAAPRETSITRLPNKVDVQEQLVLRGDTESNEIVVGLSRSGEVVVISSVSIRLP